MNGKNWKKTIHFLNNWIDCSKKMHTFKIHSSYKNQTRRLWYGIQFIWGFWKKIGRFNRSMAARLFSTKLIEYIRLATKKCNSVPETLPNLSIGIHTYNRHYSLTFIGKIVRFFNQTCLFIKNTNQFLQLLVTIKTGNKK